MWLAERRGGRPSGSTNSPWLGLVGELRCVAPDPFEDLTDVLRIFTAEVLEGQRIQALNMSR